jgi:hypothetical protein
MSLCNLIVCPAPEASAPCRSLAIVHTAGAAIVKRRFAHQLDLDIAVDALDRANQHVVRVLVGRRPRMRSDLVVVHAGTDGQRIADQSPPTGNLPRRQQRVRPRLVRATGRHVDPKRP